LLDIESQRQSNKEITASALPQINGNASLIDYLSIPTSLIPAAFTGGPADTYIPIKFGTKYNGTYGADLQQILFDGQVFVGLQARKTSIELLTTSAEVTKEQIKANVYKIYYQLVVGQRQIGTINANIDNYEKLLHDTKEIYKNGFAEKLDVDKVQVQLNNLVTQKLKAQNQLDAGNASLKFLMNMPQKDNLILTDTLSDEELKSNILDEEYNYEDRKEFKVLGLQSKLQEFNVRRYKLSKIPTLTFSANVNQNAQRTAFNFFKSGQPYFTTSFISFKLSVPIFDGGARNAKIASAKLDLLKTNNNIEQLKSSIDNDVKQSRINMKSALVTMDSQKKNIELAQQVYNTTKLKYEQGLGSNQEINTAQTDLITAQNNYYSSLYDAIIAKIDFLKAAGKL
ncbi:MAG: TolC family protein, partial [Bacteroidota bacterium]|nr:TolC family protein [Bacteroidota bacterium]